MIAWIYLAAANILLLAVLYRAWQHKQDFENAYFLLLQWREFGKSLAALYPEIYAELQDHKANGERWDMRKVNAAAEALAKLDKP